MGIEFGKTVVQHQPRDGEVGHLHALGCPGGTGGVEDVGNALRGLGQVGISGRLRVQIQLRQVVQHMACAAVFDDEGLAFDRRVDVQRHIHRSALEDRQLADQQIQATRQGNRHAFAGLHPLADQMMGQAVGTAIEVTVAQ